MSYLIKQGRFVANFLHKDESSSVIHAKTVDELCDRIEQLVIYADALCKVAEKIVNMDEATHAYDLAIEELEQKILTYKKSRDM